MTAETNRSDRQVAVKICGIASCKDFDDCHDAGSAFIGMVFFPRSPRHMTLATASAIADHADAKDDISGTPQRVALTVNMPDEQMDQVVSAARPHFIQLHGSETPQRGAQIRDRYGLPLIRAIRVAEATDLDECANWDGIADWLILDAKGDPDGLPGGTGHSFDWSLLDGRAGGTQWMLAGGLSVDNVERALAVTGALALDVSSGVESAPGKKDASLIRTFVSQARLR